MIVGQNLRLLEGNVCLKWRVGVGLIRVPTTTRDVVVPRRPLTNQGIFCDNPVAGSRKGPTWRRKRPSTTSYGGAMYPTNGPALTLGCVPSCTAVAAHAAPGFGRALTVRASGIAAATMMTRADRAEANVEKNSSRLQGDQRRGVSNPRPSSWLTARTSQGSL